MGSYMMIFLPSACVPWSAFKYQCFAQAQDKKTVELILSYMGGGFNGKGRSLIKKPMS
jgi:hypothetical protein